MASYISNWSGSFSNPFMANTGTNLISDLTAANSWFNNTPNINLSSITASSNHASGSFYNGGSFNMYGSGFNTPTPTINDFIIKTSDSWIFEFFGNITINTSNSSTSGLINHMIIQSPTNENIDITGDVYISQNDASISNITYKFADGTITATGPLTYHFLSNTMTGNLSSFQFFDNNNHKFQLSEINIPYQQLNTYTDLNSFVNGIMSGNDLINGTSNNDVIQGFNGNDILNGGAGIDTLVAGMGDDTLDGGDGTDTAVFNIYKSTITDVHHLRDGGAIINSTEGVDTLKNIEDLRFLDGSLSIDSLIAERPLPSFTSSASDGTSSLVMPTKYTGPVTFLEYELLGKATGDVITGSIDNDFMNLLGGDDAANGGAGDDVLDGGTGSNFLTGGSGNDTIFLDGRGGSTTWSTVTDFSPGDQVNIWGWNAGVSKQVFAMENQGADGYKGATFHYDLNNDGLIDTSITLTGLALSQVPTSITKEVAGNGYLFIG